MSPVERPPWSRLIAGEPFRDDVTKSWQNGWDAARRVKP